MKLKEFLNNKPIFYKKFDFNRMPNAFEKVKPKLTLPPIVHVVGTNGKGSTGRWLSLMLLQAGHSVGHYTSPHILNFNERFWLNGKIVSDVFLDIAHQETFSILGEDTANALSYFEYATFLAAILFKNVDFAIFEAGLGGEFDATNVFNKKLSIVTPIGFDHEEFLGNSLKEITTTKLNSITTTTIISKQNDKQIIDIATNIANTKGLTLKEAEKECIRKYKIDNYTRKYSYPDFLKTNIETAFVSALALGIAPQLETLAPLDLQGRFQKLRSNITLDVGHNPLSAEQIVKNFQPKSVTLIYNSFEDKDIEAILNILAPIIKKVEILPICDKVRKSAEERIKKTLESLNISWRYFNKKIKKDEEYLVFGSFYVADAFLRSINEK